MTFSVARRGPGSLSAGCPLSRAPLRKVERARVRAAWRANFFTSANATARAGPTARLGGNLGADFDILEASWRPCDGKFRSCFPALAGGVPSSDSRHRRCLWLGSGRIAGISGIFGQLLPPAARVCMVAQPCSSWRWFCGALWRPRSSAAGARRRRPRRSPRPGSPPRTGLDSGVQTPVWIAIAAGLLTGLGTRIGNGCTSGHGICGLARLVPTLVRRRSDFLRQLLSPLSPLPGSFEMNAALSRQCSSTAGVSGLLFGSGLYVSQMVDPLKVLRLPRFRCDSPRGGWDPSVGAGHGAARYSPSW